MVHSHLRIYRGPEGSSTTLSNAPDESRHVRVPLGQILPLLADAVANKRTWLRDFDDDEITLTSDLYEVLMAYKHYRRPSA